MSVQTTKVLERIVYPSRGESSTITGPLLDNLNSIPDPSSTTLSKGIENNPFLSQLQAQNPTQVITTAVNDNIKCGVPSISYTDTPNPLVVNGEKTRPGEWPWLVALFAAIRIEKFQFQCGGSILTTKHIITGTLKNRRKNSIILIFSAYRIPSADC